MSATPADRCVRTIEVVTYLDACVDWSQTGEVRKPITLDAVGFVIGEDDDSLTLAAEIVNPESRQARAEYRGQLAIPTAAILRRTVVGAGRPT